MHPLVPISYRLQSRKKGRDSASQRHFRHLTLNFRHIVELSNIHNSICYNNAAVVGCVCWNLLYYPIPSCFLKLNGRGPPPFCNKTRKSIRWLRLIATHHYVQLSEQNEPMRIAEKFFKSKVKYNEIRVRHHISYIRLSYLIHLKVMNGCSVHQIKYFQIKMYLRYVRPEEEDQQNTYK